MKQSDINIVEASIGGKINKIRYYHLKESRYYTLEEEDMPHPDLFKSLKAFNKDLAEAYSHLEQEMVERFMVDGGFSVDEKAEAFSINLKGHMKTSHEETVKVSSGNVPVEGELVEKLATVREELFKYGWEGKAAQQQIPFPEDKEKEGEENE